MHLTFKNNSVVFVGMLTVHRESPIRCIAEVFSDDFGQKKRQT